jgi:DNA replication protein DnaC
VFITTKQNDFVSTVLEVLGIKRTEDLLFKCRSDLIGKVREVKTQKENCNQCGQPNIFGWNYKMLDGTEQHWRVSDVCTNCLKGIESKQITQELLDKRQNALTTKWYNIPPEDQNGFKNYQVVNKATEKALKIAKEYTKEILAGKLNLNLLLMGSTGTGKTHLARTVAKTAKEKGLSVAHIESVDLFQMIKGTFGNERHYELLLKEYTNFDLVVVDDVGLETIKQDETSWSVREWTSLINVREGKATVFTTNLDDEALAKVVGQRAFSRMYMNTKFIDLFTDDFRKKLRA